MTDIVIMDLDGVLCDNSHRAHLVPPVEQQHRNEAWQPFVAECVNDSPITEGLVLYHALVKSGTSVVIVTSRQEMFETLANKWLDKYTSCNNWLICRDNEDNSSPASFKRDVLHALRTAGGHNILFAIDDDPSIIAMYNAEGVPTFQPNTYCSSLAGGGK